MGAPVVKVIDDCLDPYELLPGKTRSSTLKRYVDYLMVQGASLVHGQSPIAC